MTEDKIHPLSFVLVQLWFMWFAIYKKIHLKANASGEVSLFNENDNLE
jgi:hypothetical protein